MSGEKKTWVDVQKKTFTRWSNSFLRYRALKINDLETDLDEGVLLVNLLEILSDKSLGKINKAPKMKPQKLENISAALKFITSQGIKLVGIGPRYPRSQPQAHFGSYLDSHSSLPDPTRWT
jgi:hypothetical protein